MTTDAGLPIDQLPTRGGAPTWVAVVTRTARAEDAGRGARVRVSACRAFLAALPVGSWVSDPRDMAEGGDVVSQVTSGWTDGGSREALGRVLEAVVEELGAVGVRVVAVVEHEDRVAESLAHLRRAAARG